MRAWLVQRRDIFVGLEIYRKIGPIGRAGWVSVRAGDSCGGAGAKSRRGLWSRLN